MKTMLASFEPAEVPYTPEVIPMEPTEKKITNTPEEYELIESDGGEAPDMYPSSDEEEPAIVKVTEDTGDSEQQEEPDVSWPEFFEFIKKPVRYTEIGANDQAKVEKVDEGTLSLAFFEAVEHLHGLPEAEPEYIEVEMTLDTGASGHAINRLDLPGFGVVDSPGSRAGQNFQAAGGKLIANEGQVLLVSSGISSREDSFKVAGPV